MTDSCFNPTVVRLKVDPAAVRMTRRFRFQSHCGAIKRHCGPGSGSGGEGFNPTVVRLKVACAADRRAVRQQFQSHCGAIKRKTRHANSPVRHSAFQSHCGAIKRIRAGSCRRGLSRFQSHCGAIKRRHNVHMALNPMIGFNPTVVRLKAGDCSARIRVR